MCGAHAVKLFHPVCRGHIRSYITFKLLVRHVCVRSGGIYINSCMMCGDEMGFLVLYINYVAFSL